MDKPIPGTQVVRTKGKPLNDPVDPRCSRTFFFKRHVAGDGSW